MPALTEHEKAQIWQLAKAGCNWISIGRQLGKSPGVINGYAHLHGGVAPRVRARSCKQLTLAEREEISRGLSAQMSIRRISVDLGLAPSTVSREVNRHGGRGQYRALSADRDAWDSGLRPKTNKLGSSPVLRAIVEDKLTQDWSPDQIAGWLRRTFPDQQELQVSHETIYLSLFVQARGALKKELTAHLRSKRMIRRGKTVTDRGKGKGQILGAVNISERAAEVEDRAVPGHWEGDMILGSGFTQIATLVERHSRFTMLVALTSRATDDVVPAIARHIQTLPDALQQTLTWDRGTEMAKHRQITIDTGVQVYFCDPRSPWQRGTNENTNGLLRQYFPKRTSLAGIIQEDLDTVAAKLNNRPRKTLDYMTPSEKLEEALH